MINKVIIITGASSGIGFALAKEFAKNKNIIVMSARNKAKLETAANKIKQEFDAEVLSIQTDVSKEAECKYMINKTIKKFGRIDVLINNAGVSMRALFKDLELKVLHELMDINFWGTVYASKYALNHLLKSKGHIVAISSIAGYKGLPGRSGYSSSKFAMHGFLESVRIENLKTGLKTLLVAPGFTASNIRKTSLTADGTAQTETPRDEQKMMTAEKVAEKIHKAITKNKKTLTLTTQGKLTVILNKFFPKFMDKMVYNHFEKEKDSPLK